MSSLNLSVTEEKLDFDFTYVLGKQVLKTIADFYRPVGIQRELSQNSGLQIVKNRFYPVKSLDLWLDSLSGHLRLFQISNI